MKKIFVLAILALPLFSVGCGMITVNGTGIPALFTSTGTSVTIKNDSDYVVTLVVNNRSLGWEVKEGGKKKICSAVAPGARVPIEISNWWSGYDQQVLISVDGWSDQRLRESVGSDSITLTAGSNQNYPYSLRVVNDDRNGVRIERSGGGFLFR